jgi:UDP-N-acetylglucosamine 2-epimerase (non-hydrolysing)/GDP/UDP-N,N'-diacetylbacillosamine 2-epimerase (hydrolysing)
MRPRGKLRKIAVVTTSRADAGHLHWILKDLAAHPQVDLRIISMGAHLSPEFGHTGKQLHQKDLAPQVAIECLLCSDTDIGMAKTIGVATLGLADALGEMRPDIILLTADRYEMLAPAAVALALRIPIAHIEGGEISEGAIDDAVRNAITKMAHLHFACTQNARERIIQMGEEPWRAHFTGSPSIDQLRRNRLLNRAQVERQLNISITRKTIVVVHHPVTLLRDTTRESTALFAALSQIDAHFIFVYPNADAGSRTLIARTEEFLARHPNSRLLVNLDHRLYLSLLSHSAVLVGNSSSGIIEAASLGLPVVNIGIRQKGRDHAANVLNVPALAAAIRASIAQALSPKFRNAIQHLANPYGDGNSSEQIVELLTTIPLGEKLLFKRNPRVPHSSPSLA